jgi:histidinol dehydrogenase
VAGLSEAVPIVLKAARPAPERELAAVREAVAGVLEQVRRRGDAAVREFTRRWDGVDRPSPVVSDREKEEAWRRVDPGAVRDLEFAAERIRAFAHLQMACLSPLEKEVLPGVHLGHRLLPLGSAAVYVPGGRYPLPSTALMGIIPARVAGVPRVVACAPPDAGGGINPYTLVAMQLAGADEVYCMGGAQAVAALAFGTESVRPVDIIVGPGNEYVTEAKRQVAGMVRIDFPAGPSEVLVVADHTADPALVAADLLAQCEHDPRARATLVTTYRPLAQEVLREVEHQLSGLPTARVARDAWEANGEVYLVPDLEAAVELANERAPEHLEVHVADWRGLLPRLKNYGSLFLGALAAEVFGDYVSGTNHILPTGGAVRFSGGLWVGTFLKVCTHQWLTYEGARLLAPVACRLSALEGLAAHARAARLRS